VKNYFIIFAKSSLSLSYMFHKARFIADFIRQRAKLPLQGDADSPIEAWLLSNSFCRSGLPCLCIDPYE